MKYDYDIIVIGAGPAGAATTLYAARAGLNVLLLDKSAFPRDKTCGDAISRESVQHLQHLGLKEDFMNLHPLPVIGAVCYAPDGTSVRYDLPGTAADGHAFMYICPRKEFDHLLVNAAQYCADIRLSHRVHDFLFSDNQLCGVKYSEASGYENTATAPVIVGADGYNSVTRKMLSGVQFEPQHMSVAMRGYYADVEGLNEDIEIHFPAQLLPGYLWIFPVNNNRANVGIITLHTNLKKRNQTIRQLFDSLIHGSYLKKRFSKAQLLRPKKGWHLPLASKTIPTSGNGFILVGDAAGLVDPLSGEGIGNALRSAQVAGDFLKKICREKDYSAGRLREFDHLLFQKINRSELKLHYRLQLLSRRPSLINFLVRRIARNNKMHQLLQSYILETDHSVRKKILSPATISRFFLD